MRESRRKKRKAKMETKAIVMVSWRALIGRLSRALARSGTELVAPRGRQATNGAGTYWLLGEGRESLKKLGEGRGVVVKLAKDLGVVREWEEIVTGGHPDAE